MTTVWFDDDCGLCSTVAARLSPRTPGVDWRPARGLADPALARIAADAIVCTDGASAWTGVEAVRRILATTGWLGRAAAWILDAPGVRPLAGVVYRQVAGHRAQISARLGLAACAVPPGPGLRSAGDPDRT